MTLRVESEIGHLRRVLVHRPGYEIDRMVPSMMERLLFDDILDGDQARAEHDGFVGVLHAAGVETLDPQVLLAEVLRTDEVRAELLSRLHELQPRSAELAPYFAELDAAALAEALVSGVLGEVGEPDGRMQRFYRLPPVPNYFFQRDPQFLFGDRVAISSMATQAREREPLLARTVFEHHPALGGWGEIVPLGEKRHVLQRPELEGGDVLVPSPELLLVGHSERTSSRGIEALAEHLRSRETTFRHLLVVELPRRRSYMHLDTVFTFIDRGLCLASLPVIAAGGSEAGRVYRVDLQARQLTYTLTGDLQSALAELGMEVELVPCGGRDSVIDQQREQWTDGANAFAIAPGVIVLYRRNRRTTEELSRRGWRVIGEEEVLEEGVPVLGEGPTVITLLGNELARARGGPRCMTMPLERDPLD